MWMIGLLACGDGEVGDRPRDRSAEAGETAADTGTVGPTEEVTTPTSCAWLGTSPLRPTAACPVWTLDRSVVVQDLVIERGTVLEVAAGATLRLEGSASASGTAEEPIVLRSAGQGAWGGLELVYEPTSSTYYNYDSGGPSDDATRFELRHVEVRDAGADRPAAITVNGGYYTCGDYDCATVPSTLLGRGLRIVGSASGGIAGDGDVRLDDPVAFQDVADLLLDLPAPNLERPLAIDLGGNRVPAIRARPPREPRTFMTFASQAVPIELTFEPVLDVRDTYYDRQPRTLTIEPNTLRFPAGIGVLVHGGRLEATGVTFESQTGAEPWAGLRTDGDDVPLDTGGYTRETMSSEIRLEGCTLRDSVNPAVLWVRGGTAPEIRDTLVTAVHGDPGQDVCVAACGDFTAAELGNTFECAVPVYCPR